MKDEHLDLKSLVLEYQVDGANVGETCRFAGLALLGARAGTPERPTLRVRASVADKAGNLADAEIVMPEGTAGETDFATAEPGTVPPR